MWIPVNIVVLLATVADAAQRFNEEPSDAQVTKGQTHIFACSVVDLVGKVQWMKNGFGMGHDRDLPGYNRYSIVGSQAMGEYNLMISNVQLEDDAFYECQIGHTTQVEGIASNRARLDVLIPPDVPVVEGGPQVVVTHGEEYNLTCSARNSKPGPNITWSTTDAQVMLGSFDSSVKNQTKLVDGTSILTITPDKKLDQGRAYKCHAMNVALTNPKWTRVYLQVQYPPDVTMTEYPRVAKEYGQASFKCEAIANPADIVWKWFADGVALGGETSNSLVLKTLSRDLHTKDVVCEATNSVGSSSKTFKLNIEYGPRFVAEPEHAAADVGGSSSMLCRVDGNPSPAVFWRRKDEPSVLSTQEWFNITAVSGRHFGVFTCTASAPGFADISRDVHLMEKRAPRVIAKSEQEARYGETGVLSCLVESVPKPPEIIWQRNGANIDFEGIERYTVRMKDVMGSPQQKKSVIEIISVQDDDFGKYNCSVDNGYGFDAMEITFTKQGEIPSLITIQGNKNCFVAEVLPLPYILAAILVGVLLIIILSVLVFVYHKRRNNPSADSDSELSEDSIAKRKDPLNCEPKVGHSDSFHSNPVDACMQPEHDFHCPNYAIPPPDEYLEQTPDDKYIPNDYDFNDGYGNNGYDYARDIYGTFPRNQNSNNYNNRFPAEDPYGVASFPQNNGSIYGTYRPPNRMPYAASDYGPSGNMASEYGTLPPAPPASDYGIYDQQQYGRVPPPPPSITSRLSTNV
ncbi:hypothetical protein CAPTEDRAFT_184834 [Capitella teleta]|uniref:Ig-like domain-containing protein n=1 Tax=Capitella teleta TaxID=283909 RepID=R7VHR3_CAPTE|nr:hypothetical protein CAPTEDRAFT_184834 [Capitella teleta]|eukprot:ELU18154.1 hypothetical protein CAPTEDRAFT_184834 [Capitella teleta]